MMPSCTAPSGARRSSWRRSRGWMMRLRRKSRRRWLLIDHPYSGSRGESKLPRWDRPVHREMLERNRPVLARILDDLDPPHQAILLSNPHRRRFVRQILYARCQRDHIDRSIRQRIAAHVARAVPLAWMLDELPDEIGARGPRARNRRANHLSGCRARRVEPEATAVGDDAIVLGVAEAHRKIVRPPLVEPAARRVRIAEHRVVDDLREVSLESADRVEGCAGTVENRSGILDRQQQKQQRRHAPTAAGSATRRPMASAIIRTSRINCAN